MHQKRRLSLPFSRAARPPAASHGTASGMSDGLVPPRAGRRAPATAHRLLVGTLLVLLAALVWLSAGGFEVLAQGGESALPGRIAYTRAKTAIWDIFTASPDGGLEQQVTETDDVAINRSAAGEQQPRWSADGEFMAFTTFDRSGERTSIWQLPWSGGTPTAMVANDRGLGDPAWERPRGRCIAYSGARTASTERATDLLLKCPEEAARTIVDTADLDEAGPDWKHDGTQLVYEARRTGWDNLDSKQWDLWTVNRDGTDRQLLIDAPDTAERHGRWSPDGQTIAFVQYAYKAGLGKGTLVTVDLRTGDLTYHVEGAAGPMAWSPDGRYILFYNTWDSGPKPLLGGLAGAPSQGQVKGLYLLEVETHAITRLQPPAGGSQATDGSFEWGYAPDWTRGTLTPTPIASNTPTATNTPPATATPTASPTHTAVPPPPNVYLPYSAKGADRDPTPTPPDTP